MSVYKDYTFRIDEDVEGVTRESVKEFLEALNCIHVVAYEISDKVGKPHYQGWVRIDCTYNTWGKKIKERWPQLQERKAKGRKQGAYSGAPVREKVYYDYVLKGTKEATADIVSAMLPIGETLDLKGTHQRWWAYQAAALEKKVTLVEEGIAAFTEYEFSDDMQEARTVVAKWLVNKGIGKAMNSFLYKNYINGILCGVSSQYKELFIRQLADTERW